MSIKFLREKIKMTKSKLVMMIYFNIRYICIKTIRLRRKVNLRCLEFMRSTSLDFACTTQVPICPRRFHVRRVSRVASTSSARRDANWNPAHSTISRPLRLISATISSRWMCYPPVRSKVQPLHLYVLDYRLFAITCNVNIRK